jgi:hypothetical protein
MAQRPYGRGRPRNQLRDLVVVEVVQIRRDEYRTLQLRQRC